MATSEITLTTASPLEQYRTDYICTYQEYTDKEEDFYANLRYQLDFLRAFGQTVYDDTAIENILEAIYETFKDHPGFAAILNAAAVAGSLDQRAPKQWALMWCYSYNIMYAMHPFVSHLIIHKDDVTTLEYRRLYDAVAGALIAKADADADAEDDVKM